MSPEQLWLWIVDFNVPLYYYYRQIRDDGLRPGTEHRARRLGWARRALLKLTHRQRDDDDNDDSPNEQASGNVRTAGLKQNYVGSDVHEVPFPGALKSAWLYFVAYCVKYSLNYVPALYDSRVLRIVLSSEFLQDLRVLIETILLVWCVIAVHFLTCCRLKSELKHYRFLRIFLISPANYECHGLTLKHYRTWARLKSILGAVFVSSLVSLTAIGTLTTVFMFAAAGLFDGAFVVLSVVQVTVFGVAIVVMSAFTYSNFIVFILSAEYINRRLKHLLTVSVIKLSLCLSGVRLLFGRHLRRHYGAYMRLKAQQNDYDRFWSPHLTCVILLYILQLTFLVFSIFFEHNFNALLRVTFVALLVANLSLLWAIVEFASRIRRKITQHSFKLQSIVSRFFTKRSVRRPSAHSVLGHLKDSLSVFFMLESICDMKFGFCLQNDEIITNQTFQFILLNTIMYFLLFMKQRRGLD